MLVVDRILQIGERGDLAPTSRQMSRQLIEDEQTE